MKVTAKIYKGIEYIQLSDLPAAQRNKLVETLNHELFIKILVDEKVLSDCLQFKDYEYWFNSIYQPEVFLESPKRKESILQSIQIGLPKLTPR